MRWDYNSQIKKHEIEQKDMSTLMKKMGKKWSKLPKEVKSLFNEAAKNDKERFDREMDEFKVAGDQTKNIQDYDAQRPKKCLSSYMIFVKEMRPKVAAELKEKSAKEGGKPQIFNHFRSLLQCHESCRQKMETAHA